MQHRLLIITLLLSTNTHLSTALPATPPTKPPPPKDPCGPTLQPPLDPSIPPSTCTTNVTYNPIPSTRGILLTNDGTSLTLNYNNCYPVILDACLALTSPLTPLGVWNFTGVGSECVLGFWLPEVKGAAKSLSEEQCVRNVYLPMRDVGRMRGEVFNQVSVNLRRLPDQDQMGVQVSAGYPSFTITALPLVWNETFVPA